MLVKIKFASDAARARVAAKLRDAVIKVRSLAVAAEFVRVLKAGRCRFIAAYLNAVSKIFGARNMLKSTSKRLTSLMTI